MTETDFENYPDEDFEYKSKTQLKQEMLELKALGEELVNLSAANLAKIPLEPAMAEAIALAQRINRKKDGFRRQIQLIGKLMRSIDVEPIRVALNKLKNQHQQHNRLFHKIEGLRDKIVQGDNDTLETVLAEYPDLDRQRLRQLKRAADKQTKDNTTPKAAREIFQYLKDLIQE